MVGSYTRCTRCSSLIHLKPNAKKAKYCGACRKALQDSFRSRVHRQRKARTQNIPSGPIEMEETERTKE